MGVTFVNKSLEYIDTFNYLGMPISAKSINFKLMCQSKVSAATKMSTYFKAESKLKLSGHQSSSLLFPIVLSHYSIANFDDCHLY